jgi:hypothetical protein
MKRLAAAAAVLLTLLVGGCTAAVFLVGGAGAGQAASCPPGTASIVAVRASAAGNSSGDASPGGGLPARIGSYRGEQIANAAQVLLAARDLGVGERGQVIAVMTAIGESTLLNVDHGDAAGPDSRGLFQQRANGAWGSYADRMNPYTAATNFLTALQRVPGWESMPPTLAAHATQHNADPYHYEPFWDDAVRIVATLGGDPHLAAELPTRGDLPCAPGAGGPITGPGGSFPPEACSAPDPTTGRGCLTARMLNIATQLQQQGWSISCWDAHAWNPTSDHPRGRACDVFPGKGGALPTAAQKATGDALAAALQATAAQTGVHYLIWYGQIWSIEHADDGWRPYTGGGIYDPGDITGGHYDHLHISVH